MNDVRPVINITYAEYSGSSTCQNSDPFSSKEIEVCLFKELMTSGSVTYAYFTGIDGDITSPNNQMVYSIVSNVQDRIVTVWYLCGIKVVKKRIR